MSLGRERELFDRAVGRPPSGREAFLRRACPDDPALRQRVLDLLAAHDRIVHTPTGLGARATGAAGGPETIGSYRVLGVLGEGGMGVVYHAEQSEPIRRQVAIKVIRPGMGSDHVLRRFETERRTLALLDHPHVARVIEAGELPDGRPYFVMEHVEGEPITDFADRTSAGVAERLGLFLAVCGAVQHAHTKGVIHRDLKPSNILVTVRSGRPEPKVIDFGIAKALEPGGTDEPVTQLGQAIGTLEYMSPEQAEGRDVDTRTDVYALGVLLYELLTGVLPFDAETLRRAAPGSEARETPRPSSRPDDSEEGAIRAERRRTDPRTLARSLRGDLDWIVIRALEPDPERRYTTVTELAADLRRHLAGEPVQARPPSAGYRIGKFVRRHRAAVLAGCAVALALILGLAGTTLGMIRARKAEDEAVRRGRELERVTGFQQQQLSEIDPSVMGLRLRRSLLDAVPEEQRSTLEGSLAGIDFTQLTLRSLQENVFDPTRAAIDEQFGEYPPIRAGLLQTLATTLKELGAFDSALAPQREALDIRQHLLGDDDPETLRSLDAICNLLVWRGEAETAEPYCREAIDRRTRVLGENHPDTLVSIHHLATMSWWQGEVQDSEAGYRRALDGRRRVLGDDHRDTIETLNYLGALLVFQDRLAQAEPVFREAVEASRRVLGREDRLALTVQRSLADLLRSQGKFAEAEPLYLEALEVTRRVLGEEHAETLGVAYGMNTLRSDQGHWQEAERGFRRALEISRRVLGDEHANTLNDVVSLGTMLRRLGRDQEAESYLLDALTRARRVLGDDNQTTMRAVAEVGNLYFDRGRYEEAERCYREAQHGNARAKGEDAIGTLIVGGNLGETLARQGRFADAEPLLRRSLEGVQEQLGTDHPQSLASSASMGELLRSRGEPSEAEPYHRRAFEGRRRVLGDMHPHTLVSLKDLAATLNDLGRYGEALELLRGAEAAARDVWIEGNAWRLADHLCETGTALGRLRRSAEAERAIDEARRLLAGIDDADPRAAGCAGRWAQPPAARRGD